MEKKAKKMKKQLSELKIAVERLEKEQDSIRRDVERLMDIAECRYIKLSYDDYLKGSDKNEW